MYSEKQKYEFVSLRAEGFSYQKISEKLNIPLRTLFRWGKDLAEEISACKEAALESILSEHKATANERISNLAIILEKLDKAILDNGFGLYGLVDLMNWKLKVNSELLKHETKLFKSQRFSFSNNSNDIIDENPELKRDSLSVAQITKKLIK